MRWQRTSGLSERAPRAEPGQGPDKAEGNPVHLLRHPHDKRGAVGGQNRTETTTGGLLNRKHAHRNVLHRGTMPLSLRMDKMTGRNDRNEI